MPSDSWRAILQGRLTRLTNQLQTKTKIVINILTIQSQNHQRLIQMRWFKLQQMVRHELKKKLPSARDWRRLQRLIFHIDRSALAPYMGLLIIAGFVIVGNQANQRVLAAHVGWQTPLIDLPPETVQEVLTALDPLTPELHEEPEVVASGLLGFDDTYLSAPNLEAMTEAATLSKRDPIAYVVHKGDTMVSIADAHDRTVATILDANGIQPENAAKLQPGTTLLIPQEDTSTSLAWLEVENKARAEAARKRAAAKEASSRTSASSRQRSSLSYDAPAGDMIVPINHNGVSRGLGRGHTGIDYRANVGTSVAAASGGRVIEITRGWAGGWGTSILLDNGSGVTSRYAHLADVAVSLGETVSQGETIGYSGSTGRSTGPHLHFEVRVGGRPVNPF